MNRRWGVASLWFVGLTVLFFTVPSPAPGPLPISAPTFEAPNPRPPPTENWMEIIGEGVQKKNRKKWFQELHRAAPDVDWRAIERENGRAQIAKRNALAGTAYSQRGGYWVERGSDNQAGRMHVVAHSRDGETIVAGSSKGGIWKRRLDSDIWDHIGDNLYGGAHWLAVLSPDDEADPDIILSATDWGAVYRTTDDGLTWQVPIGLEEQHRMRRLIVTSDDSETVFIVRGYDNQHGLYRSTDAGKSFQKILHMGKYRGDLWTPRDGDSTLYLTLDDALLMSPDMGDNWTTLGVLNSGSNRSELVGSEAGAPTLYAVTKKDGEHRLHRSDDGGANWREVHAVEDYWSSLAASMVDPDLFAWGGVELHVSRNGGEGFSLQNKWWDYYDDVDGKLHADIPGIDVLPNPNGDGEIWYISTDGGLFHSTDALATVNNLALRGLRVSQYYTTHTSIADPNHVAAGAQDQGYQRTESALPEDGLYSFKQHISGDYARHSSTDGSHDLLFCLYPGVLLIQMGEYDPQFAWADFPENERYAWLPPLVADPSNGNQAYFGATKLYRYERNGADPEWFPVAASESMVVNDDEYISAIAFSEVDTSLGWLITNYGRLFKSEDNAASWSQVNMPTLGGHYFYGQALLPSKVDRDTLTIGGSGYSNPAVYRTTDGGESFFDWSDGLPATMVYSLGEPHDESGEVFAGTETAAYRRGPDDDNWQDITTNQAPVTIYWSVEALHHENTMRFGTYGRGIWDFRLEGSADCSEDVDGDGFTCDVDCDDEDATVYPGAEDTCDGVDANCDPEDLNESDEDGDGFIACDECDDSNRFIHPDASDNCEDGIDKNCNGTLDCEEPKGGCACASAAPFTIGAWWLLLPIGLGMGRRRPNHRAKETRAPISGDTL